MASIFKRGGSKNRGGAYTIQFIDHTAKRVTKSSGTTDRAAALRIAAKLETDAALLRSGVIDHKQEAFSHEGQRPFSEHLTSYRHKLEAAQRSHTHITETIITIEKLATACDYKLLSDINADRLNAYAAKLRTDGRSARTIQKHLAAVKSFTRWLVETRKIPFDPLASIKKPNPKTDRRHERRMLLPAEWTWLRASILGGGKVRDGMTAAERVALYGVGIVTGLRSNELRSLTRSSLHLDGPQPFIVCAAANTKNKKSAKQFLPQDIAQELRGLTADLAPRRPVFPMPHPTDVARMLRADVVDARAAWIDDASDAPEEHERRIKTDFLVAENHTGQKLDFHSLRHTTGSWLALQGCNVKTIQSIMRHSSAILTLDLYSHLLPGQEADSIARLPSLQTAPERLKPPGQAPCAANALHTGCESGESASTACDSMQEGPETAATPIPLVSPGNRSNPASIQTWDENGAAGTRTQNQRIMSLRHKGLRRFCSIVKCSL